MRTKRCLAFLLALILLFGETTSVWAADIAGAEIISENEAIETEIVSESMPVTLEETDEKTISEVTSNDEILISEDEFCGENIPVADADDSDESLESDKDISGSDETPSAVGDISGSDYTEIILGEGVQFTDETTHYGHIVLEAGKAYYFYALGQYDNTLRTYLVMEDGNIRNDGYRYYYYCREDGDYELTWYTYLSGFDGASFIVEETKVITGLSVKSKINTFYNNFTDFSLFDDLCFVIEYEDDTNEEVEWDEFWPYYCDSLDYKLFDKNGERVIPSSTNTVTGISLGEELVVRYYLIDGVEDIYAERTVTNKGIEPSDVPEITMGRAISLKGGKSYVYKIKYPTSVASNSTSRYYYLESNKYSRFKYECYRNFSDEGFSCFHRNYFFKGGQFEFGTSGYSDGYVYLVIIPESDMDITVSDKNYEIKSISFVNTSEQKISFSDESWSFVNKFKLKVTFDNGKSITDTYGNLRSRDSKLDYIYFRWLDENKEKEVEEDKLIPGKYYLEIYVMESSISVVSPQITITEPVISGELSLNSSVSVPSTNNGSSYFYKLNLVKGQRYVLSNTETDYFNKRIYSVDFSKYWYLSSNVFSVPETGVYYLKITYSPKATISLSLAKQISSVVADTSSIQDVYYYDSVLYRLTGEFKFDDIVYEVIFSDGTSSYMKEDDDLWRAYGFGKNENKYWKDNLNSEITVKVISYKPYDLSNDMYYYDYSYDERCTYTYTVKTCESIPVLSEDNPVEIASNSEIQDDGNGNISHFCKNPDYLKVYYEAGQKYVISYSAPVVYVKDESDGDYAKTGDYSYTFCPKESGYMYLEVVTETDTTITLHKAKAISRFDVSYNSTDFVSAYGEDSFNPYNVKITLFYGAESEETVEGSESNFAERGISYTVKNNSTGKIATKDALGNYPVGKYSVIYSVVGATGTKSVPMEIKGVDDNYKIKFNANGGSGTMREQSATKNTIITLKANAFSRKGYKFVGWSLTPREPLARTALSSDIAAACTYTDKQKTINVSEEGGTVTLYAVWQVRGYSINYVLSGGEFKEETDVVYTFDVSGNTDILLPAASDFKPVTGYSFDGWYKSTSYKSSEKVISIKAGTSSDVTVYAKWVPKTYNISFVGGEGSTGTTKALKNISYNVATKLSTNGFSKKVGTTKYGMTHWTVSGNDTDFALNDTVRITENEAGVLVSDGTNTAELPAGTKDIVLVANWDSSFTVTYHYWDGSEQGKEHKYGDNNDKVVSGGTRTGYTFAGWYTDGEPAKKVVKIDKELLNDLDLYQKWTENSYTIKFDSNLGSGKSFSKKVKYTDNFNLPVNTYTKSGYKFMGWTTAQYKTLVRGKSEAEILEMIANGEITHYANQAATSVTELGVTGSSFTLYAIWVKTNYTLTLDNYADTMENVAIEYSYSSTGSAKDVSGNSVDNLPAFKNPKREGYTFGGWFTDKTFKTKVTTTKKMKENTTLYALWKANATVKFVDYRAIGDTTPAQFETKTVNVKFGDTITLKGYFKRDNSALIFWQYMDAEEGENDIYYVEQKIVLVAPKDGSKEVTFNTCWKSDYTIMYDAASLEGAYMPTTYAEVHNYGTETVLPTPVRYGYSFAGWYRGSSKENLKSLPAKTNEDTILYARWTGLSYTINFVSNAPEGTKVSGTMKAEKMNYGTPKALTKNAFKINGYTFMGWSTNSAGTGDLLDNAEKVKQIYSVYSQTVTLYAVWEVSEYEVNFALNAGEETITGMPEGYSDTYTYFSGYELPENPGRMGYTFQGWYTDSKCKKKAKDLKAGTTGNKTFYAKWKAN